MTPLFKKMNFKAHKHVLLINAPETFADEKAAMEAHTEFVQDLKEVEALTFALVFCQKAENVLKQVPAILEHLAEDGIFWLAYPKGTSKHYKCDFNRDSTNVWAIFGAVGYEGVRQIAIDADWSALRFRKTAYIKNMTRSLKMVLSEEGKAKTLKKNQ